VTKQVLGVLTRDAAVGQTRMWGTLYIDPTNGTPAGWLCNSWTEGCTSAADVLQPEIHWLSKEDGKFYRMRLNIPFVGPSAIEVFGEDKEIDPRREAFIRATIAGWEDEYLRSRD
jgi:hypothetical protein